MSMNVSTTTAAYASYQNNYKTGTANKKKKQNNLMEKKTVIQCKNGKAQNHCFLHRI